MSTWNIWVGAFVVAFVASLHSSAIAGPGAEDESLSKEEIPSVDAPLDAPSKKDSGKSGKKHSTGGKSDAKINFDEELVEGMDKTRLDSLTAKMTREDDDSKHLYRKRVNFRKENPQVMKEFTVSP